MNTCCPYCETVFAVDDALVGALDARARCSMCRTVFNARDQLVDAANESEPELVADDDESFNTAELLEQAKITDFDIAAEEDHIGVEMDDTLRIAEVSPPPEDVQEIISEDIPDISYAADESVSVPVKDIFEEALIDDDIDESEVEDEDATALLDAAKPRQRAGRRWWLVGSVLLLLAVGAQWAYAQRNTLASMQPVRATMELACGYLGCELAPLRDVEKIELLRRSVYSHPNIDDALIISLAMVNNANYAQPFPVLGIRMADVRGQIVAERNFDPQNYLEEPGLTGMMSPGAPITVTLEVHDPGNDALTFELEFY